LVSEAIEKASVVGPAGMPPVENRQDPGPEDQDGSQEAKDDRMPPAHDGKNPRHQA
jgi:hypothetical protein